MHILRSLAALAAGLALTLFLVTAIELWSQVVHPAPAGFGGTPEEVRQLVERYPAWVLAAVLVLWGATAFAGTWTAMRLGDRWPAVALGVLTLSMLTLNLATLPYVLWFKATCPIVIAIAIGFGCRSGIGRASPA